MKKILYVSFLCLMVFQNENIVTSNNNSVTNHAYDKIRYAFTNNETYNIEDYYFDDSYETSNNYQIIEQELLNTSSTEEIYYNTNEISDDFEIVKCNYSTFKNHVYNSSKSTSEIYSIVKSIPQFNPYIVNDNTPYAFSPDINIEKDDNQYGADFICINVLTSGAGGSSSSWSNNGNVINKINPYSEFYLNDCSLPYKIASEKNSNVILGTYVQNKFMFSKFFINDANILNPLVFSDIEEFEFENDDVLIFNYWDWNVRSNDYVYDKFEDMMNLISTKYVNARFNLIGHSRGGLINSMYAVDNPSLVENIISVGTPYFPVVISEAADNFYDLVDLLNFEEVLSYLNVEDEKDYEGYGDLASDLKCQNIRSSLNDMLSSNPNIDMTVFAINTELIVSFYVPLFFYCLRVDVPFRLRTDFLVDYYNASGKNSIKHDNLLYNVFLSDIQLEPLSSSVNRKDISIEFSEILDAINKKKSGVCEMLSVPEHPVIPHNMETMSSKFHDEVLLII